MAFQTQRCVSAVMHWTPPSAGFDPTLDRLGFVSSTRDDEGELITAEASSCRSLVNRRAAGACRLFPNTRGGHDTLISFHFVYVPSTEKTWNLCWIYVHNWRAFALQHENLIHPAGQASIESIWAAILELHYIPSVWSWKRRTRRGKGNDKSIANTAVINAVVVAVLFFWKAWRKVRLRSWLPHNLIWKDRWEWQHRLWLRVCGGTPEDGEGSAAPLTPPPSANSAEPLNGSCPSICPSNLSSHPSRQKVFPPRVQPAVDAPPPWTTPFAGDRMNVPRIDPDKLRPLLFPFPQTSPSQSIHVAFGVPRRFAVAATVLILGNWDKMFRRRKTELRNKTLMESFLDETSGIYA